MKLLQTSLTSFLLISFVFGVYAQKDKSQRPSPPAQVSQAVGDAMVTIDFSQPSKKGRIIFGDLVKFGEVWRTGANETSWIELSKEMKIEGKTLAAGKYGLYTIPGEEEWVIIFNTVWSGWGAYDYKKKDDVLRIKVPVEKLDSVVEKFTINIEGGDVTMAWDQTQITFTIE